MRYVQIAVCIAAITIQGCFLFESDDTDDDGKYRYSFKNQPAQGKIGGESWSYLAGRAEQSGCDSNELSIELFEVAPQGDTCSYNDSINQKSVYGLKSIKNQVFMNWAGTTQIAFTGNKITSLGAIEIVKFDTLSKIVTGKVDGFCDENTNVNGTFSVKFCE